MNYLKMEDIKVRIMDGLIQAGFTPVRESSYVKWSKGRSNFACLSNHLIRTTINSEASGIIRRIAGAPNGSAAELQQGKFDSWYTDGYKSFETTAA